MGWREVRIIKLGVVVAPALQTTGAVETGKHPPPQTSSQRDPTRSVRSTSVTPLPPKRGRMSGTARVEPERAVTLVVPYRTLAQVKLLEQRDILLPNRPSVTEGKLPESDVGCLGEHPPASGATSACNS